MPHPLREDAVAILGDLIAFPTVSVDSNRDLIGYAHERVDRIGAHTRLSFDPTGAKANLFATFGPPDRDGGIVLSGHTDVVPVVNQLWDSDPFAAYRRDDLLYGRGACDMKGFIACALAMAPRFAEVEAHAARPLHLAFSYDEEVGCLGAQVMLEALAEEGVSPAIAIIGEPTQMRIIEAHKGCCEYTTRFTGTAGHASRPELGVNAIEYATRYIGHLLQVADRLKGRAPSWSRFDPPWSTLQVGRIDGGLARNIIAAHCAVEWELRPVCDDDLAWAKAAVEDYVERELLPAMRAGSPEADVFTEVIGEVVGLEPMPQNAAEHLVRTLTGNNAPADWVSFGTEAGLFQHRGIATVICGPGSIDQAHKPNEFVALDQLDSCLAMMDRLLDQLGGDRDE